MDRLLTIKEVADYLKVDYESVRRYYKSGQLPVVKIANKWVRIKESDLIKFIDERTTGYTSPDNKK